MSADRYRSYAVECLRFASGMTQPGSKAVLLDMAMNWLKLADQAEKNGQTELVYEPPVPRLRVVQ
jgi:hypothetical protein